MYVVVESGGKQHKISLNDIFDVEKLDGKENSKVKIDKVLLVSDGKKNIKVGQPYVKGCSVSCVIVKHFKQDKKIILKHKRRKSSETKRGHRQESTKLKVDKINVK